MTFNDHKFILLKSTPNELAIFICFSFLTVILLKKCSMDDGGAPPTYTRASPSWVWHCNTANLQPFSNFSKNISEKKCFFYLKKLIIHLFTSTFSVLFQKKKVKIFFLKKLIIHLFTSTFSVLFQKKR